MLAGKRVFVSHATAFKGAVLGDVFREHGAIVFSNSCAMLAAEEPTQIIRRSVT